MLTRLEVNGFKNLLDFKIDFSAFTCIAGLNGVGKSNIFDAIKFISLLAENDLYKSAMNVREAGAGGEPKDIFYTDGNNYLKKMTIAVEMIVAPKVEDDFSRPAEVTSTLLRYEIEIGYFSDETYGSKLKLLKENLNYITKSEVLNHIKFNCSAKNFRNNAIKNSRKGNEYISTSKAEDDIVEIHIHQDGGSRGRHQKIPAWTTPRTVVANTNSIEHPTILAAKREMASWKFLSLEPSFMRCSNSLYDPNIISSSGGYLASTLYKLEKNDSNVIYSIIRKVNELTKVENLKVDVDKARELLTIYMKDRSGAYIPARGLSDGTLRFLSLCIMSEDPDYYGLLCFEEPENGIHPAKLKPMLELLYDLVVDVNFEPNDDNPMRQMIVATHSPTMVQLQDPENLIFADIVKIKGPFGNPVSTIKCKPLNNTWRSKTQEYGTVNKGSIISYLAAPENAQLTMDMIFEI